MTALALMKKTSVAATRRRKSRSGYPVDYQTDVHEAFLSSSEEVSPANRFPADPSSWIPDAMELAKLAATLFPELCKGRRVESAIRAAWAVFVQSQAFCLELKALSPKKRAARLDKLNEVEVPPFVRDFVGKTGGAARMYRFDPSSDERDEVRSFFEVQMPRSMINILDDYSRARTPNTELHEVSLGLLLDAARRTDDKGNEVYEFSQELMDDIKQYKRDRKRSGGLKASATRKRLKAERLKRSSQSD